MKERLWLVTGWKVLQEAAAFERDFLLPAPSLNLRGCRRTELKYDQGYALQNRVLRELKTAGTRLFQHPVTNFWTLHSGRAYLPTATHVFFSFPKEERDFLGGWLAQASDRYARTARRKIVNMQRTVAREIRTRSASRLAEEETSLSFHDFLQEERVSEPVRNEYVNRLEDWNSFVSENLPAIPQLEQEEGDEEVRAAPEQEQLPQAQVDRPDKKETAERKEIDLGRQSSKKKRLAEESVLARIPRVRIE